MEYSVNTHGFSSATEAELDNIALLKGGFIGGHGFSSSLNPPAGLTRHGYELIVTDRRGMGNYCSLYLRGITPAKRALLRQGKIDQLVSEGFTPSEASRFLALRGSWKWELRGSLLSCLRAGLKVQADVVGLDQGHRGRYIAALGVVQDHPFNFLSCPRASALSDFLREMLPDDRLDAVELEIARRAASAYEAEAERQRAVRQAKVDRRLRAMGYKF